MMASAGPQGGSSLLPLLESLEDGTAGQSEQTDAYLTIASRLSGEEGRHFLPAVEKHFSRLGKSILTHISSPNAELNQAALQALGFCVYHSRVVSGIPEVCASEILSALCSLVLKSTDKNTCIRALWVISKQSFPPDVVSTKVSAILNCLEGVLSREDVHSVVMEHEALNVIIRLLEQAPSPMAESSVVWVRVVVPLVVHSASKVRLRAAAAMELGLPLMLQKQTEVAALIEPMMSSKLIPELQKLFMSKNETNVLKLWSLFVKLLGKLLHRGGPFINSLLHLEELGFRNSSPAVKKIAFIAWKSLIDNFSLNLDILCSAKRLKLLMQPLLSISVRTEALLLTKVEVWWYLVVQLGPNLSNNFDQVCLPLLQTTIGSDSAPSGVPGTPSRSVVQNGAGAAAATPKTASSSSSSSSSSGTPRLSLNVSSLLPSSFTSIQLLGLEMIYHYLLGPEAATAAGEHGVNLSLESLKQPLLSGSSSFSKHAAVLSSSIRDAFVGVGKDAPEPLLTSIWSSLVGFVSLTIEAGSKKDRGGSEVLTLTLQTLQSIISSEALPPQTLLLLLDVTVKRIPHRVLGSASYQVGKMDVLNGTPALFLIQLLCNSSLICAFTQDQRFFQLLQTLVGVGLSGHTSPLAFSEAVLGAVGGASEALQSKEQLWRMWSLVVSPLTDSITQSNEVNQGDALEHNFSAVMSALMFPVTHFLRGSPLQQVSQKALLSSWSKLYGVLARCAALVVTAEENVCCEELSAKMAAALDQDTLQEPSHLNLVSSFLQVLVESVDFSPFTPHFQQKLKSPHTPLVWTKKRTKSLGNLSSFQTLLLRCLQAYLGVPSEAAAGVAPRVPAETAGVSTETAGVALVSVLSGLFSNMTLGEAVRETLNSLAPPLTLFYRRAASDEFTPQIHTKLEKLVSELLFCLQRSSSLTPDSDLLALLSPLLCVLFPHRNKHLRSAVVQFWNASFAKSVSLSYPEDLRPILSHVKQKTPIILPGFEAVAVSEELSHLGGADSSSQMETNLSGITVSSTGKRESLLGKAAELKDKSSTPKTCKAVSKLDFGSPRPPHRGVLEEEASIDFVFIPPENKERVLTEHQKEVKRTKRVDIPAMYNNLDASLDTTVFTQFSQSQEDSLEKPAAEPAESTTREVSEQVPHEENQDDAEVTTKETLDFASSKQTGDEMVPESADVSMAEEPSSSDAPEDMEDQSKEDLEVQSGEGVEVQSGEGFEVQSREDMSPNVSGSSDLVSGTPQKSNSRRQSFITLEKYAEGKPATPSSSSSVFTDRPLKSSQGTQEHSDTNKSSSSQSPGTSTSPNPSDSKTVPTEKMVSQPPVDGVTESPRRPKDSGVIGEPVRLTDRLPSDTTEEDDVIPDTQAEEKDAVSPKMASNSEETQWSQDEEMVDSQSSETETPPGEPRRSGRGRMRPLLPGEDPKGVDQKHTLVKRKRSLEEPKKDAPKSDPTQNRVTRRSLLAAEEDKFRTRAQKEKSVLNPPSSQSRGRKKIRLYSDADDLLEELEYKRRRRSSKRLESSQSQTDLLSDGESQSLSQGRRGRPSRASSENNDQGQESSQTDLLSDGESQSLSQGRRGRPSRASSENNDQGQESSQVDLLSDGESQSLSQGRRGRPSRASSENNDQGQESSQVDLLSDGESQSLSQGRRGRPSRASSENNDQGVEKDKKTDMHGEASLQTASQGLEGVAQTQKDETRPDSKETLDTSTDAGSTSQLVEVADQAEMDDHEMETDTKVTDLPLQGGTQDDNLVEQTEMNDHEPKKDSPIIDPSTETAATSQESEPKEKPGKMEEEPNMDCQIVTSPQDGGQSEEVELVEEFRTGNANSVTSASSAPQEFQEVPKDSVNESEDKGEEKTIETANLSQEDSQLTPLSSDSQTKRRSRRSKASSEAAESEDSQTSRRQSRSGSKTASSSVGQTEVSSGGRTRRSKAHEEPSTSTPENSQSLDTPGSTEGSQGKGRLSRRRSQPLVANKEPSESDSSEAREVSRPKRGRGRPRRSETVAAGNEVANPQKLDTAENIENQDSQTILSQSGLVEQQRQELRSYFSKMWRKEPQAPVGCPLTIESEDTADKDGANESEGFSKDKEGANANANNSQELDSQNVEAEIVAEEPLKSQDSQVPETVPDKAEVEEPQCEESLMDVEVDSVAPEVLPSPEKTEIHQTDGISIRSSCKKVERDSVTDVNGTFSDASSQEKDTEDSKVPEPVEASTEQVEIDLPSECPPAAEDQVTSDPAEKPQITEFSEDKPEEEVSEAASSAQETLSAVEVQEPAEVPLEDGNQAESLKDVDELPKEDKEPVSEQHSEATKEDEVPLVENDQEGKTEMDCENEEELPTSTTEDEVVVNPVTALSDLCKAAADSAVEVLQGSPVKQKDLEAVMASDVGQSPSSGRLKGTWSPSASPSTSILKKGQKRPLEEDTPSPCVKSRRVSFANPIQQQETADDIDRRSPALRTSSPRRPKVSSIPQPKFITTPTKGLLVLSPRNMRSPGSKSSKKCLISEMSGEPRPVPRDCIYPPLVGCSAPVEAVLPQISSNMWSRGIGQLVRARNIKTVGDLSALTPTEIKSLPIRSPKISNVKKALRIYQQQHVVRGVDELKSFDETEMMTSELEETRTHQNQEEDEKNSTETLATELLEDPVPADLAQQNAVPENQTPDATTEPHPPPPPGGLLSDLDSLTHRMTPVELSLCSPQELGQIHQRLGGLMGRVVVELQTRLGRLEGGT